MWDGLVGVRIHGFISIFVAALWVACVWGNGSIGCTNNNYASREKCKKCGQPKEVAAMPAIAMPGVSLPTYMHYFARNPGGTDQTVNIGLAGNGALQQPLSLNSSWSVEGAGNYGVQQTSAWTLGNQISGLPYGNFSNQPPPIPKGWRNGDWLCSCGFHNYSSRAQCKKCNASLPPAIGTKRLASQEFVQDWESKRLNSGNTSGQQQTYPVFNQMVGTNSDPISGVCAPYPSFTADVPPNWQATAQIPLQATAAALLGKGAKQWRHGDWMCTNCNNHNYASRAQCNRCQTQKEPVAQPDPLPVNVV